MATTISDAQVKELENLFRQHKGAIQPAATTHAVTGGVTFCGVWPSAKSGLQLLQQVIDKVPGVSLFAGAAIAIVIAAGDAAYSVFCKP